MRMTRRGIFCACLLTISFFIIGCSNPNVTAANFQRIKSGMSRADVVGIMGEPDDENSGGGGIAGFAASGTKLEWKSGGRKIIVTLVDEQVLVKLKKGF